MLRNGSGKSQEFTQGQLILVVYPFAKRVPVPPSLVNWTMTLEPDGSWYRYSSTLGVPSTFGLYTLRQAVDGEGKPGPYWESWLKARGGKDFVYGEKSSASG